MVDQASPTNIQGAFVNLKPRNNQVLIKTVEEKQEGLLGVPDSAKDKPQIGIVQGFGAEVKDLKEGDKVLYQKWAGDQFPGDETVLLMSEEFVVAIILPEEED